MGRVAGALFLIVVAAGAAPQAPPKPAPGPAAAAPPKTTFDKSQVETYLRRLELWAPEVDVRIGDPQPFITGLDQFDVHLSAGAASKDVTYFISSDRTTIVRGASYRLDQDPFQPELEQLKSGSYPAFGPESAPLTLAVFSDFQCPLCREEARELRQKLPVDFPDEVRVRFVNMPLVAIHSWAKPAAIGGRCVYRQSGQLFWDYHDWMFEHQGEITPGNLRLKAAGWAKGKPLDAAQLAACMEGRTTEIEVNAEMALGKKLDVDSTPTLFLEGRRLVGHVPWQNLSQIIRMELEFRRRK
jgi:protein-disulfide isomerase